MNEKNNLAERKCEPIIIGDVSASPFFSFFNADNMEIMKQYPDKYFDLAIVDPPYGINANQKRADTGKNKHIKQKDYHVGDWDSNIPPQEYFNELKRISKNQIIWGGNYFLDYLQNTSCMIVWDKDNGDNYYADCELAWTSFSTAVRKFKWKWHGFLQQNMQKKQERIHPTEKPIELYEFIIKEYGTKNMKIIDTHLGSGSIALAIDKANKLDNMNLEFVGIELDTEYFNAAVNRFRLAHAQSCLSF